MFLLSEFYNDISEILSLNYFYTYLAHKKLFVTRKLGNNLEKFILILGQRKKISYKELVNKVIHLFKREDFYIK